MGRTIRAILILFILIFTGSFVSRANEQKICKLLDSSSLFIVGEIRGQSDSARLVSDIVEAYTGFGK